MTRRRAHPLVYGSEEDSKIQNEKIDWVEPHAKALEAMDDDFSTPEAVAVLSSSLTGSTAEKSGSRDSQGLGGVLGLLQRDPVAFFQGKSEQWILEKIAEREAAQPEGLRGGGSNSGKKQLLEKGIVLEDKGSKTTWRRG